MIELFHMGGMLFMSILTIELLAVGFFVMRCLKKSDSFEGDLKLVKSTGLLAAITGILGQLIGLFSAFEAIQQMGSVSPAMLAGGIKVSMITTIYGVIIYLLSIVLYLILKMKK
ncbi:MotA/TolQ/ExbB proton channel family protein [Ekhidna sp.]|uniref:MotA/TolQ/ExbB proton channel family protein n=1 Tax=Ekhidna sp. TaxID=2608089 RepID=UPI003514A6BC